jgi:Domain of unknown function (DUF5666)
MTTEVSMNEPDTLPVRPRRRLLTPWSLGLTAVIIAAAGFLGGVEVQKAQGDPAAAAAPRAGGFPGAASQTGAAPVAGKVASKDGRTLYVTTGDGTTIKVKSSSSIKVTRNATSRVSAVHPGDTVIVQGTRAADGTVTAVQITATESGVTASGGFGGFGRFGGGNSQGTPSVPGQAGGG